MAVKLKKKALWSAAKTPLERHVAAWVIRQAEDYKDTGCAGVFKDLFYGGCSSGIVGHLVYSRDCLSFARRYLAEILSIMAEDSEEFGESPAPRKDSPGWSPDWLAWYGFERTAQRLADRVGYDG